MPSVLIPQVPLNAVKVPPGSPGLGSTSPQHSTVPSVLIPQDRAEWSAVMEMNSPAGGVA